MHQDHVQHPEHSSRVVFLLDSKRGKKERHAEKHQTLMFLLQNKILLQNFKSHTAVVTPSAGWPQDLRRNPGANNLGFKTCVLSTTTPFCDHHRPRIFIYLFIFMFQIETWHLFWPLLNKKSRDWPQNPTPGFIWRSVSRTKNLLFPDQPAESITAALTTKSRDMLII